MHAQRRRAEDNDADGDAAAAAVSVHPAAAGDDVEAMVNQQGCGRAYAALEECMGEHSRDWRKCQKARAGGAAVQEEGEKGERGGRSEKGELGKGAVVALGKFDALHTGHRALAAAAASLGEGTPCMLSFSGAYYIRRQSPEDFVSMLVRDLGVRGVVAGSNYRFGFRAAGDAGLLCELAKECGIACSIVELVEDNSSNNGSGEQVSSTRVRGALAKGDMSQVASLLARPYRLIGVLDQDSLSPSTCVTKLLNQPPGDGEYEAAVVCLWTCRVGVTELGRDIEDDSELVLQPTRARVVVEDSRVTVEWPPSVALEGVGDGVEHVTLAVIDFR
eukprot:jgi/Chlat1/6027/Chrsp4S06207